MWNSDHRQDASQHYKFDQTFADLPCQQKNLPRNFRQWMTGSETFSNSEFQQKWLDPLLAMFSDPTYWIKSKMNQNRDSISFLNTKVDQKKSTPKNNLSQTVLEFWNNSVSANYSNIHLWYEKSKLYIVAYRRSDTSQWLEIIRLTFLPKNSKSQWAFLRNRGFLKLKK